MRTGTHQVLRDLLQLRSQLKNGVPHPKRNITLLKVNEASKNL